jgi:nicotinamidase-related amidase
LDTSEPVVGVQTTRVAATTALVCVDMQRDFVEPGAPAAVTGATRCVPAIARAARAIRERGSVVWVNRAYAPDGSNVERSRLAKWSLAPFVVAGSPGAEMVAGLGVEADDIEMLKPSFSAFLQTDLDEVLSSKQIEQVVLCGVDLARCVRASAADALSLGYMVTVLSDGTATRSDAAKAANLEDLVDLGALVTTSAALDVDEVTVR